MLKSGCDAVFESNLVVASRCAGLLKAWNPGLHAAVYQAFSRGRNSPWLLPWLLPGSWRMSQQH